MVSSHALPVSTLHPFAVLSILAVSANRPSGVTHTPLTAPECPVSVATRRPAPPARPRPLSCHACARRADVRVRVGERRTHRWWVPADHLATVPLMVPELTGAASDNSVDPIKALAAHAKT